MTAILVCSLFSFQGKKGAGYFGVYTFQREIVRADGSRVEFYESGDKYFSYCHDKDGFILIREGDELYYAYNDNGRPVASDVRYGQKGLAALTAPRMLASEIDFDSNPDLLTDYPVDEEFHRPPAPERLGRAQGYSKHHYLHSFPGRKNGSIGSQSREAIP